MKKWINFFVLVLLVAFARPTIAQVGPVDLHPKGTWVTAAPADQAVPFQDLKHCQFRLRSEIGTVKTYFSIDNQMEIPASSVNPALQNFYFYVESSPQVERLKLTDPLFYVATWLPLLQDPTKRINFLLVSVTTQAAYAGNVVVEYQDFTTGSTQYVHGQLENGYQFLEKNCSK